MEYCKFTKFSGSKMCRTNCRFYINERYPCTLKVANEGDKSLKEIAKIMGLTEARICQIIKGALTKLHENHLFELNDLL